MIRFGRQLLQHLSGAGVVVLALGIENPAQRALLAEPRDLLHRRGEGIVLGEHVPAAGALHRLVQPHAVAHGGRGRALAEHVDAVLHGADRIGRVLMEKIAEHHRVDAAVQQPVEILADPDAGFHRKRLLDPFGITVADGRHLRIRPRGKLAQILHAPPESKDTDPQFFHNRQPPFQSVFCPEYSIPARLHQCAKLFHRSFFNHIREQT